MNDRCIGFWNTACTPGALARKYERNSGFRALRKFLEETLVELEPKLEVQ